MISLLIQFLPLILLVYKEFLSGAAQAKAEGKAFTLDQAKLHALVATAMQKQIDQATHDSAGAGSGWDAADKDKPKP